MKWSEFKVRVAVELKGRDPEILYLDIDDLSVGKLHIDISDLGLIITESEDTPPRKNL